jgi:hypothetical protein
MAENNGEKRKWRIENRKLGWKMAAAGVIESSGGVMAWRKCRGENESGEMAKARRKMKKKKYRASMA